MITKMPGKLFTATPDGQKFILNQNNCKSCSHELLCLQQVWDLVNQPGCPVYDT